MPKTTQDQIFDDCLSIFQRIFVDVKSVFVQLWRYVFCFFFARSATAFDPLLVRCTSLLFRIVLGPHTPETVFNVVLLLAFLFGQSFVRSFSSLAFSSSLFVRSVARAHIRSKFALRVFLLPLNVTCPISKKWRLQKKHSSYATVL